jgi:hypothetical protein
MLTGSLRTGLHVRLYYKASEVGLTGQHCLRGVRLPDDTDRIDDDAFCHHSIVPHGPTPFFLTAMRFRAVTGMRQP